MNKHLSKLLSFLIFITFLLTALIFHNSFQDSQTSNTTRESIALAIKSILEPQEQVDGTTFHLFIQKLAHGVEFYVLVYSVVGLVFICLRNTVIV